MASNTTSPPTPSTKRAQASSPPPTPAHTAGPKEDKMDYPIVGYVKYLANVVTLILGLALWFIPQSALALANGDQIIVASSNGVKVRQSAGGAQLGSQISGARGKIISNSQTAPIAGSGASTTYTWWNVDFNSGQDGWVASDAGAIVVVLADTSKPTFSAFSVSPTSLTQGNLVTISYTVSDSGSSGLARSQLWRAPDSGGAPGTWAQVGADYTLSGNGPTSRSFSDTPIAGIYWYGVHADDNAGNFGEQQTNGGFNPVKVSVAALYPGNPSGPTPANGAVLASQPLKLDWTNTPNASTYDMYLKVGGGSFSKVGADLPISEWSPNQTYLGTAFSWYVVAKNSAGPTTGPIWTFDIAAPPSVTLTSPNGGEIWGVGSSRNITLSISGGITGWQLDYSTNGGTSWNLITGKSTTTTPTSFGWSVPNAPSNTCRVRITLNYLGGSVSDTSTANFAIVSNLGDLALTLEKPDGSAVPVGTNPPTPRIKLYTNPIRESPPGTNPAVFQNLAAGTYLAEAYYSGTFWGEEFWNSEQITVNSLQTNLRSIRRKYPYATSVTASNLDANSPISLGVGTDVKAGNLVRFEVTVRNDALNTDLSTQVRLVIDRDRTAPYDYDFNDIPPKIIPGSGGTTSFLFEKVLHGDLTGVFYYSLEVNSRLASNLVRTDSWNWNSAFSVSRYWNIIGRANRANMDPTPVMFRKFNGSALNTINTTSTRTWLVVHGRQNTSYEEWVSGSNGLAAAISTIYPSDQVLLLDWGVAAADITGDTRGEDWIEPVAKWAASHLEGFGIYGQKLNIIGHSWGGNMSAEIAELVPWRKDGGVNFVNSIVALDPARNGAGSYDPEDSNEDGGLPEVDFARNSLFSWAFRSSSLGSAVTPTTADEAIAVNTRQIDPIVAHRAVINVFIDMLIDRNNEVSQLFSLGRLISAELGPWKIDQYYHQLLPTELVRVQYEAYMYAMADGTLPQQLTYISNATGSEVRKYATIDTTPLLTVTGNAGSNGAVNPEVPQVIRSGGSATFTATPFSGYVVSQWLVDGSLVQTGGNSYTLSNVTSNKTVQVTFKLAQTTTFTVTPNAGPNGGISPSSVQTVASGGSAAFTATAFTGYMVDQWLVGGSMVQTGGNSYTLSNVSANRTVLVTFKVAPVATYSVAPSAGANGSISPNSVQTVNSGGSVAFTATPFTGYVVDQWLVNGSLVQTGLNSFTLSNVTANRTIQVTFKVASVTTYSVTPSAGGNGSISPNSVQTVNSGGSASFTATPFSGYVVDQWLVNGSLIQTGGNSYTLSNLTANKTVLVNFKLAPDTIQPSVAITSPTNSSTHSTSNGSLNLVGSASDNVGVTQVTWGNDRGGSGTASGLNSWSVTGIALSSGQNIVTVTARDAVGNTQTDTLTVTYNAADTTKPVVTITAPVNTSTYATTTSSLSLGGTASDAGGITQVTWSNDRGGSGTAAGSTSWSVSGITLSAGQNILTISGWDTNSNIGTDTLTVTYTPPGEHPWKGPVTPLMVDLLGGRYFGINFNRLTGVLGNGIRIEGSANLRDWVDATPSMLMHGSPVANLDGIRESVTFRCPLPVTDSRAPGLRFLRLAIVDSRVPVVGTVNPVIGTMGGAVTLNITTSGDLSTRYDWYRDWTLVGNTTIPQFQIPSLSTSAIGTYRVVAHNAYGSATSNPFLVQAGGWTYDSWLTVMVGNGKTPTSPGYARSDSLLEDGHQNLTKYAFGSTPSGSLESKLPHTKMLSNGGTMFLGIEFERLLTPKDVGMRIEASGDLVSWRDVTASMVPANAPVASSDGLSERVTFQCPVSLAQAESQNWRYLRVAVTDLSSPTVLLSDDFNDSSIDTTRWTASGNTVQEQDGYLKLLTNQTDAGGKVLSRSFLMPTNGLTITRKARVHFASAYSIPSIRLHYRDGANQEVTLFSILYGNMSYDDGIQHSVYGTFLGLGVGNPHNDDLRQFTVEGPAVIWDAWFDEKITYDRQTGLVRYFRNGVLEMSGTAPGCTAGTSVFLQMDGWGWFTGHWQHCDDLIITSGTGS